MCVHIHTHIRKYICTYVYTYIRMYMYNYVHTCVCIHIYTSCTIMYINVHLHVVIGHGHHGPLRKVCVRAYMYTHIHIFSMDMYLIGHGPLSKVCECERECVCFSSVNVYTHVQLATVLLLDGCFCNNCMYIYIYI